MSHTGQGKGPQFLKKWTRSWSFYQLGPCRDRAHLGLGIRWPAWLEEGFACPCLRARIISCSFINNLKSWREHTEDTGPEIPTTRRNTQQKEQSGGILTPRPALSSHRSLFTQLAPSEAGPTVGGPLFSVVKLPAGMLCSLWRPCDRTGLQQTQPLALPVPWGLGDIISQRPSLLCSVPVLPCGNRPAWHKDQECRESTHPRMP